MAEEPNRDPLDSVQDALEERLVALVASAAEGILSIGEDGRIRFVNAGAAELFGYDPAEMVGLPIDALLPGRHREDHRRSVARFARTEQRGRRMGFRRTVSGLRRDGRELLLQVTITRLPGEPLAMAAVVRDVTEEALRDRESELLAEVGALLSSVDLSRAPDLVSLCAARIAELCTLDVLDGQGRYRRIASAPSPGCPPELANLLTRRPLLLAPTAHTTRVRTFRDFDSEELDGLTGEPAARHLLRAIPGAVVHVVELAPRGQLVGGLLLMRTESSPPRPDRPAFLVELGRRVATALDNARLFEQARDAVATRDAVLGVIAHDLRGPLSAVATWNRVLEQNHPELGPETERVGRIVRRMARLVDDLLDVSTIERGEMRLSIATERPLLMLEEAATMARMLGRAHAVEVDADPDLPPVAADRDRVARVFANAIANALRFTPPGGRVGLSARLDGDAVRFAVADDGAGVTEEDAARAFQPFWQAARTPRGVGLGLSICRSIVGAHGGEIALRPRSPRGTELSFTLPLARPGVHPPPAPSSAAAAR